MDNLIDGLEKLTHLICGRQMTQEEIDRFDAAIDYLQKAIEPCRVEARLEKK